jgi:hypothetical protein
LHPGERGKRASAQDGDAYGRYLTQVLAEAEDADTRARIIYLEPELPSAEVPQPGRRSQR